MNFGQTITLVLGLLGPAPVHEFYSDACCAGKDCHPVLCEEIIASKDGWQWQGMHFGRDQLRDAPDGACHVCVVPKQASTAGPVMPAHPTCIYLPPKV